MDSLRNGTTDTNVVRIHDGMGHTFEQAWTSAYGQGKPFVKNQNSSGTLDVQLSFMPRDIKGKIWIFGDSYVEIDDSYRWPYYLLQKNMDRWLINGFPGEASDTSLLDLQSLLALGAIPTYVVWTLGMNDRSDTLSGSDYIINPGTKTAIDSLIELCADYGIIPIIATIPTTPYHQNTGKNDYIKSLGCRYIDFSEAVGADSSGNWKSGLLYTDNTHPTQAGARVLAARALLDAPELSIVLQ